MHEASLVSAESAEPSRSGQRHLAGRLRRLVVKELREILRDRRTIITLVVMPLLIYPLLALVFQRFLLTSLQVQENVEYVIGIESEMLGRILANQLQAGQAILEERTEEVASVKTESTAGGRNGLEREAVLPRLAWREVPADQAERYVADSSLHLAVLARRGDAEHDVDGLNAPMTWELVYRAGSPTSEAALHHIESRLQSFSASRLDAELKRLGVSTSLPAPTVRHAIEFAGAPAFSLAALIPLILVLMTVTGAVYPAIDLTAGERERGTLETLIAAPVPRLGLLLAKYIAVLAVALLTALVNLLGMTITAKSTGLAATLFGDQGMTVAVVLKVLLLLGLFAAFFSAILLALTSYARSFKEAQAYIIPLMLLCLVPGVVCLVPGLEFTGWLAVTPLVNIVLLARDVLEGDVQPVLAMAAVLSTGLYVAAAIALAARIFGTDAILYGSPSTWADLFRRPEIMQPSGTPSAAMFTLAMMFPLYFVLASALARSQGMPMDQRFVTMALITALVFGCVPALVAVFNRVRLAEGFALRWPGGVGWLAAAIFGLALWPLAHEVFLMNRELGMAELDQGQWTAVKQLVVEMQSVPWVLLMVSFAIAPGIFEELFFRGFLYTSLESVLKPWRTIVASALLFGVFHVVSGSILVPERFLPSTFLGLALGWVRWRTGSVLASMVVHMVHNGFLVTVTYWRDELIAQDIGVQEQEHMPLLWIVLAVMGVLSSGAMLVFRWRGKGRTGEPEPV